MVAVQYRHMPEVVAALRPPVAIEHQNAYRESPVPQDTKNVSITPLCCRFDKPYASGRVWRTSWEKTAAKSDEFEVGWIPVDLDVWMGLWDWNWDSPGLRPLRLRLPLSSVIYPALEGLC